MVLVHCGVTSSRNKYLQHGKFRASGCHPDVVAWKMRWLELHTLSGAWNWTGQRLTLTDAHRLWDLIAALRSTLSHCCIMLLQTTFKSCFSLECLTNILAQILLFITHKPFLFFILVSYTLSSWLFIFCFLAVFPLTLFPILLNSFFLYIFLRIKLVDPQRFIGHSFPWPSLDS